MTNKFCIEPLYICVILPEDCTDDLRILWSEMLADQVDICPFPLSPANDKNTVTHWLCLHESTTLDWKKIEIFCQKRNFPIIPTAIEGIKSFYSLFDPNNKCFIGAHPIKEVILEAALKDMNLVIAPAKMRRSNASFQEMKKRQSVLKGFK